MKILITGGAGYIGSTISNYFLDLGYHVTIIDNLSTGYKFLIPRKARFIKSDISNKKILTSLFKFNTFDFVIHLAGFTNIEESLIKPKKYIINNYYKSKVFINECYKFGLKKIIFSSTAAVYANSKTGFVSEKSLIKIKNPYAGSKFLLEKFLKKKSEKEKGKYIILRYFNVAGADFRIRSGSVYQDSLIKNILNSIVSKKKIFNIYGNDYDTDDGTAVRDFIHIMDLAEIHLQAIKYLLIGKKNLTLNCGYNFGYSVNQVLEIAQKIFKTKLSIRYLSRRKGDLPCVISINKKLIKYLKWSPRYQNLAFIFKSAFSWQKKINNLNLK
jgi:UDP-glucose 4-epimerase